MAVCLRFGVLFATGITLLLTPCSYMILENIHSIFARTQSQCLPEVQTIIRASRGRTRSCPLTEANPLRGIPEGEFIYYPATEAKVWW